VIDHRTTTVDTESVKERAAAQLGVCAETGREHIADDLNPSWIDTEQQSYHCFWCGAEVNPNE